MEFTVSENNTWFGILSTDVHIPTEFAFSEPNIWITNISIDVHIFMEFALKEMNMWTVLALNADVFEKFNQRLDEIDMKK